MSMGEKQRDRADKIRAYVFLAGVAVALISFLMMAVFFAVGSMSIASFLLWATFSAR